MMKIHLTIIAVILFVPLAFIVWFLVLSAGNYLYFVVIPRAEYNSGKYLRMIDDHFIGDLAVSSNEKNIVFNYQKNQKKYIYTANIDGSGVKLISNSENGISPSFSNDNEIVFITKKGDFRGEQSQIESTINIVNLGDSSIKSFLFGGYNIREIVFSPDNKGVYFINSAANEIFADKSFRRPYQFNIYYMSFNDLIPMKVTDFKEDVRSLSNLMVSKDRVLRYEILVGGLGGKVPKGYTDEFEENVKGIRKTLYSSDRTYGTSTSDDGNQIVTVRSDTSDNLSWYELYLLDGKKPAKRLTNFNLLIASPKVLNNSKRVVFLVQQNFRKTPSTSDRNLFAPDYKIMQVGLDGNNLRDINILVPN